MNLILSAEAERVRGKLFAVLQLFKLKIYDAKDVQRVFVGVFNNFSSSLVAPTMYTWDTATTRKKQMKKCEKQKKNATKLIPNYISIQGRKSNLQKCGKKLNKAKKQVHAK